MILLKLLFAHALGDYFLQTDYLASSGDINLKSFPFVTYTCPY